MSESVVPCNAMQTQPDDYMNMVREFVAKNFSDLLIFHGVLGIKTFILDEMLLGCRFFFCGFD